MNKFKETTEEFMYSQVFGLDVTQEQINEAKKRPRLKPKDVLFGKIARDWHRKHPMRLIDSDEKLLGS